MISNNEMIRIRRQMQRRIRDVVAERRRARLIEPSAAATPPAEQTDALAGAAASPHVPS